MGLLLITLLYPRVLRSTISVISHEKTINDTSHNISPSIRTIASHRRSICPSSVNVPMTRQRVSDKNGPHCDPASRYLRSIVRVTSLEPRRRYPNGSHCGAAKQFEAGRTGVWGRPLSPVFPRRGLVSRRWRRRVTGNYRKIPSAEGSIRSLIKSAATGREKPSEAAGRAGRVGDRLHNTPEAISINMQRCLGRGIMQRTTGVRGATRGESFSSETERAPPGSTGRQHGNAH